MENALLEQLRKDLSRPREISDRNAAALMSRLGLERALGAFARERLDGQEEFELEILFSPFFTPCQEDRFAYEAFLPDAGVPRDELTDLPAQLAGEELVCSLEEGGERIEVVLPEVAIERYLRLLHLDRPVETSVADAIRAHVPDENRGAVMSLARVGDWSGEEARGVMREVLAAMDKADSFTLDKMIFLTEFIRTHPPHGLADLAGELDRLLDAYKKDENNPVFNEQLEEFQTGAIRSEHCGDRVKAFRLARAAELLRDFGFDEKG